MTTNIPKSVIPFTQAGCWVVGGAADPHAKAQRDWDLMVPWELWPVVAPLVPPTAAPNAFGGWKFTVENVEIDLWPDSLDRFLVGTWGSQYLWYPKTNIRYVRHAVNKPKYSGPKLPETAEAIRGINWGAAKGLFGVDREEAVRAYEARRAEAMEKRTCNRHDDCDAADKRNSEGRAYHCHDDGCEDCFGS